MQISWHWNLTFRRCLNKQYINLYFHMHCISWLSWLLWLLPRHSAMMLAVMGSHVLSGVTQTATCDFNQLIVHSQVALNSPGVCSGTTRVRLCSCWLLASGSVATCIFTVPKINFQQNKDLFFLMLLGLNDLQNNNLKVDLHLTAKYTMCGKVTVCKLRCPGSLPSTCVLCQMLKKAASWSSKLLTALSKKIYFIYPEYLNDCITDVSICVK